jgi:hypothetical protein
MKKLDTNDLVKPGLNDVSHWRTRSPQERLDALEEIRRRHCVAAGIDLQERLSREVFRVIDLHDKY